jgi:hypothetical protein
MSRINAIYPQELTHPMGHGVDGALLPGEVAAMLGGQSRHVSRKEEAAARYPLFPVKIFEKFSTVHSAKG